MILSLPQSDQLCQYDGCTAPATDIACGKTGYSDERPGHPFPAYYCNAHARVVADERSPEYVDFCPNCGCMFGVN